MNKKNKKFNTKIIHGGHGPDELNGAVMPPINLSSTFKQTSPGNFKYEYARTNNPTREILEKLLVEIENGDKAFAFSSGMAAINCLTDALGKDYHILCSDDVYGGTRRLFDKVKSTNQNIETTYADLSKENNWKGNIKNNTKIIWIETPSNPLLKIIDIKKITNELKDSNIITICDNTFASPYNQQPLSQGADVVIHSSTKYLGGHSDLIGGCLIIKDNKDLSEKIQYIQNAAGAIPSPFDCYLLIRSIKTLSVRMEKHNINGLEVAKFLQKNNNIKKVFYPGLETDKNFVTAKKQMKGFGGILSIDVDTDLEGIKKILNNLSIFTLAESLGGVESLIEHPAIMTHASIKKEIREELGITDGLLRLSIGIEDIDDIINDLDQALKLI